MGKNKSKAIVFVGFRFKQQALREAKQLGFKRLLITQENGEKAKSFFDEVVVGDIHSKAWIEKIAKELKKKYQIVGVVSNYEHYVIIRSHLAEVLGVPTAPLKAVARSRNKALQRISLKDTPFNIDFRVVSTWEEAKNAFHELGGDAFLKSIAGIKSRMIFHVKNEIELKESFQQISSLSGDTQEGLYFDYQGYFKEGEYPDPTKFFLIEKNESGQQVTVSAFADESDIYHAPSICDVYSASDLKRDDSFLAFRILPSKFDAIIERKAKKVVEEATKKLGLKHCPLFVDLFVKEDGTIKLIELASRMGGYRPMMYKRAFDLDLNEPIIRNAMGEKVDLKEGMKAKQYVSLIEIFSPKNGLLKAVKNIETLDRSPDVLEWNLRVECGQMVGLAKEGHWPVISMLIGGSTYEEVYQKSLQWHQRLLVEIESVNLR